MDMISLLIAENGLDTIATAAANNWEWTVGGAIAITAITIGSLRRVVTGCARERTRREIAAFIAEGSMTPEQGERLMQAREPSDCQSRHC